MRLMAQKGVLGSVMLIAGCCIGAGMLGLPIVTGLTGFWPACAVFLFIWFYMVATAKLLVEANSWYGKQSINLVSLSSNLLGRSGKVITWATFVFLFYCLLTAYFAKGGELLTTAISHYWLLPSYGGALLIALLTSLLVGAGSKHVDKINLVFMFILISSFILLTATATAHVNTANLTYQRWSGIWFLIPFTVTSFGFHNMIPTLRIYLNYDDNKLNKVVNWGGTLPLFIYLLWIAIMLSVIPLEGEMGIVNSYQENRIATEVLGRMTQSSWIASMAMTFSLAAIVTSILSQGLSVVDFLMDGLRLKGASSRWQASFLTFLPAFLFSQLDPNIFFKALGYVGGYAAIVLYGFIPALLVWRGRYHFNYQSSYTSFEGKRPLLLVMLIAAAIFTLELLSSTHVLQAF